MTNDTITAVTNYLRKTALQFWQSFFLDMRFLVALLYTTLMTSVLFVLSGFTSAAYTFITKANLGNIDPASIPRLPTESIAAANSAIGLWFIEAGIILVLAVLIHILVVALGEGIAWLTLAKKQPTVHFFKKAYLLSITWVLIWILPLALLMIALKQEILAILTGWFGVAIFFILFVHTLLNLEYAYVYSSTQSIRKSIAAVFVKGFGKLHLFIAPYVLVLFTYYVWALAINFLLRQTIQLIPAFNSIGERGILAIQILAALVFITWFRGYSSTVLREIYDGKNNSAAV